MSRLNLYGVGYRSANKGDSVEISTISSPRRLPVMENHLWSGYSPNQYPNNYERQHPSIYYGTSYIESNETSPEPSPGKQDVTQKTMKLSLNSLKVSKTLHRKQRNLSYNIHTLSVTQTELVMITGDIQQLNVYQPCNQFISPLTL